MLKKLSDWPYLGLIVGIVASGFCGILVAVYNMGRESARSVTSVAENISVSEKDRAFIADYAERYARDPYETTFQTCLGQIPKDDEVGLSNSVARRMRFAKSIYDWSVIACETDVGTPDDVFLGFFQSYAEYSPFPYTRTTGRKGKSFAMESDNDGKLEWEVDRRIEFGRKTIEVRFRALR